MKVNIKFKLIAPTTLIFVIVAIIVAVVFPEQIKRQVTRAMEDKIVNMGIISGSAFEDAVRKLKIRQLVKLVDKVKNTPGLTHLIILDEKRQLLFSHPENLIITEEMKGRLRREQVYETPDVLNSVVFLRDKGKVIGYLDMGLSLVERNKKIARSRKYIIF